MSIPIHELTRTDGSRLRVEPAGETGVRLRTCARDDAWAPSLTERLGLVTVPPAPDCGWSEVKDGWQLDTPRLRCVVGTDGACTLSLPDGTLLVRLAAPAPSGGKPAAGWGLCLDQAGDEHFYGLGYQRVALDLRGKRLAWERRFRHREATVPFFMSTAGYGFYSNNTWSHVFDFGSGETEPNRTVVTADGGELDLFLFAGPTFRALLDAYTQLTGRPDLPPRFALGLCYIARYYESQAGLLELARRFRERDIPCDSFSLEPGWEAQPYSMEWVWSPHRFPDPGAMIRELTRLGFVLSLWESGVAPREGWLDPKVRQNWYAQRVPASVSLGVRWFKQDDPFPRGIMSTEMEEPVLDPGAGGDPGETGLLANTLYSQTAWAEYHRLTGRRPLYLFNGYLASVASHRWPVAWSADFAAGSSLLNGGLSGHALTSFDMDPEMPGGIHFAYLTPLVLNDSWAYFDEPWLFPADIEVTHRFYAKLRQRLSGYLYAAAVQAHRTGLPLMRALVIEHPRDPEVQGLTTQHYLGDSLLVGQDLRLIGQNEQGHHGKPDPTVHVAAARQRVYVPEGRWLNFWTGARLASAGQWVDVDVPFPAGGPLLVRSGSILPMAPVESHLGAQTGELAVLDVYPDAGRGTSAHMYEDDGDTLACEQGLFQETDLSVAQTGNRIAMRVSPRRGVPARLDPGRAFLLAVHLVNRPLSVMRDGIPLPNAASLDALTNGPGAGCWLDEARATLWIKATAGWILGSDERGAADPERDTLRWSDGVVVDDRGFECVVTVSSADLTPTLGHWIMPAPSTPGILASIRLLANPPERITMGGDGAWLPRKTDLHMICVDAKGGRVATDGEMATLEVRDAATGSLLRRVTAPVVLGRAVFWREDYEERNTVFQVTFRGLVSNEVMVRPEGGKCE